MTFTPPSLHIDHYPETIRTVLQSHAEGSSLRGVSRTANLAYNTVVSLVRAASLKGQMLHNASV